MDGVVAPLDKICDLADKYDAMVMIDECHATGSSERQEKARLRLKE
jgi:glycine C-acetyltransferase